MNMVQFSYAMNFDDEALWLKMYQVIMSRLKDSEPFDLSEIMKFLTLIDTISPANADTQEDPLFTPEQVDVLRSRATEILAESL